jgi:hypothetical protein
MAPASSSSPSSSDCAIQTDAARAERARDHGVCRRAVSERRAVTGQRSPRPVGGNASAPGDEVRAVGQKLGGTRTLSAREISALFLYGRWIAPTLEIA